MVGLLELQQKIRELPCTVSLVDDEYGTLQISRESFQFLYSDNAFVFSYLESRDYYLQNLTHKNSYKWLMKYIFKKLDLENTEITFGSSNVINIFFKNKISLLITNCINHHEHDTLFVDKISISFFNIEDSLDVFNLLKKLKT